MKALVYRLLNTYFPVWFNTYQHYRVHKKFGKHSYLANLSAPKTFNEKTIASKIRNEHGRFAHLADKELVKTWVIGKVGARYVIPTYKIFYSIKDIAIQGITFPCIIKPTHLSGRVLKIKSAEEFRFDEISRKAKEWFKRNHWDFSGENQYKDLQPKLICEKWIGDLAKPVNDYKFFCFKGEPTYVQVDVGRGVKHERAIYDIYWEKQDFTIKYPIYKDEVRKPKNFDEMIFLARKLSEDFAFVRVDLYNIDGNVYFGEMTFHHESGFGPFTTFEADLYFGSLIK